jgi:hypothetical protein
MSAIFRLLLKQPWVLNALKAVYLKFFTEISALRNSNPDVREIAAMQAAQGRHADVRITLLLPGLSERHVFGGISTALEFLEGFAAFCPNLRIVVTDESALPKGEERRFPDWQIRPLSDNDHLGRTIVMAQDRETLPLQLGPNEVLVATAWWTAHLAQQLALQHAQLFQQKQRPFVYLIQDFEPGFYPWAARYMLADATYQQADAYVPVFNTRLLQNHMEQLGYPVQGALWFNPVLNRGIRQHLQEPPTPREKRVLVYGRPSVERNAFPLIVMGLRTLVAQHDVRDWTFVSAGEPHAPVALGQGCRLVAMGKLSLDDYARELKRAYVGFSLMVSPHPSYPPLEMAAGGMRVVTNGYGPKDLSSWSSLIESVANPQPQALADALWRAIQDFPTQAANPTPSDEFKHYVHGELVFGQLARQAFDQVHAGR